MFRIDKLIKIATNSTGFYQNCKIYNDGEDTIITGNGNDTGDLIMLSIFYNAVELIYYDATDTLMYFDNNCTARIFPSGQIKGDDVPYYSERIIKKFIDEYWNTP